MSGAKPYTSEEVAEMREDTPEVFDPSKNLTAGGWANYRLHRLFATVAERDARIAELERDYAAAIKVLASDATIQGEYGGCNSCCDDRHPCFDPKCSIGAILSTSRARGVLGEGA